MAIANLRPGMARTIAEAAAAAAPEIACGVIAAGMPFTAGSWPSRVVVARNGARDPTIEFSIDGQDLLDVVLDLERRHEIFWAIFSTDPRGWRSLPTPSDVRAHAYPDALRIIATVGPPAAIRAWALVSGRFEQVSIHGTADGVALLEKLGSRLRADAARRTEEARRANGGRLPGPDWVRKQAQMPAEEWVARFGHLILLWSFDEYGYGDPYLDAWVREVPRIYADRDRLEELRARYLTPAERAEIENDDGT